MCVCVYIAIYKQKGYHNHKSTRKNNDTRDQRFDLHLLNLEPRFDLLTAASVATSWHFPSCGPIIHYDSLPYTPESPVTKIGWTWMDKQKGETTTFGSSQQIPTYNFKHFARAWALETITMPWLPWHGLPRWSPCIWQQMKGIQCPRGSCLCDRQVSQPGIGRSG